MKTQAKTREEELKEEDVEGIYNKQIKVIRCHISINDCEYCQNKIKLAIREGIKQGKAQANNDMTDHLEASYQRGIAEGRHQEQERCLKIIDEFWLKADGILGNSYREELKAKIGDLK